MLVLEDIARGTLVFVDRGRKNIFCPRAQGTLATPLKKTGFFGGPAVIQPIRAI